MIFPARNLNNMSVAKEFLGPWSGCSWRRRWLGRCGHLDVSGFDWMVNVLVAGSWFPIYAIFPGKPGVVFHHGVSWWTIWINGFMWVPRSCPKVMAGEEAPWKELCCACFLSRQEVHRPVAQSPRWLGMGGHSLHKTQHWNLGWLLGPSNLAVGTPMVCLILNRGT